MWGAWSLPLLFARHYLPTSQSGAFAAAQLIVSTTLLVTSALATAYYPAIVRYPSRAARSSSAWAGRIGFQSSARWRLW